MQVIDAIEDRVQKVALSVLQGQNAVQGGGERKAIRDHVEFQGRGLIAAQYLMVSLPAFPAFIQMIPSPAASMAVQNSPVPQPDSAEDRTLDAESLSIAMDFIDSL